MTFPAQHLGHHLGPDIDLDVELDAEMLAVAQRLDGVPMNQGGENDTSYD